MTSAPANRKSTADKNIKQQPSMTSAPANSKPPMSVSGRNAKTDGGGVARGTRGWGWGVEGGGNGGRLRADEEINKATCVRGGKRSAVRSGGH